MNIFHTTREQKGVTLLLAVLFLTAGLSISLGIFYIVFVQLQINRAARDSHVAFYAADTMKECAAYYREYAGYIDVPSDTDESPYFRGFWSPRYPCGDADGDGSDCAVNINAPMCNGFRVLRQSDSAEGVDYEAGTFDDPLDPHIFKFKLDSQGGLCANARIEVLESVNGVTGEYDARIITEVDGLSSCNPTQFRINQSFDECITHVSGGCQ
ncbi:MAG: hypothetical protein AAB367_03155 [Patescibacteria group bacterium]